MYSYSLIPQISKPTRIADNTVTLLDNIFVFSSLNCTTGCIISNISDHLPIFLLDEHIFSDVCDNSENVEIKYCMVNEYTTNNFFENLMCHDFNTIFNNSSNIDEIFELFTSIVYEYFNVCCPVKCKSISIHSLQKPWINRDIKSYVKKHQSLCLLYQRGRVSRAVYSRYSNFVTSSIRRAKQNFLSPEVC